LAGTGKAPLKLKKFDSNKGKNKVKRKMFFIDERINKRCYIFKINTGDFG